MSKTVGRVLKWVLIVLATPIVLLVLSMLYAGYDPPMWFNPLTRYLYPQRELPHGTVVNLIPGYFALHEQRGVVIKELMDAGFKPWPLIGTPGITEQFELPAGGTVACSYEFFVGVGFGPDGGLLKAENRVDGACL